MKREEYLRLSEDARNIVDAVRQAMASDLAEAVGMSVDEALKSVIQLHEHGHLKIVQKDDSIALVPCMMDGRLIDEVYESLRG